MSSETEEGLPFEFRGNASEFFNIWFINLLLSLITLGLYSPWAKVRNNHYIYGNTYLCNHAFEYTANPARILIGRVIVVIFYILWFTLNQLGFLQASIVIVIIFVLLLPFFVRQAIAFRLRYTRFHGLNFQFHASVSQFYGFFITHIFLNIITLGIIFPSTHSEFKKLVINNASYGNSRFNYENKVGKFFFAYFVKGSILNFAIATIMVMVVGIFSANGTISGDSHDYPISFLAGVMIYAYAATAIYKGAWEAWVGNIVYNHTSIKSFHMINEWDATRLAWIVLSNFFITIVSFGLLYPWAKIRLVRYKLENTGFESLNFDGFEGEIADDKSALGEETADFFDFDIGF